MKIQQAVKWFCILLSGMLCFFGAAVIICPEISLTYLFIIFGILLTAGGITRLIGYWLDDMFCLAYQFDLAFGLLTIVIGAAMLLKLFYSMDMLFLTTGILIAADGMFKIQTSIDAKRFGLHTWWMIMMTAGISSALGTILIVTNSFKSTHNFMELMGIALLFEGIQCLCVVMCTVYQIKRKPNS